MTTPRPSPADPLDHAGVGAGGLGDPLAEPGHHDPTRHHPTHHHPTHNDSPMEPRPLGARVAVPSEALSQLSAWPDFFRRPVRYPNAYCWYVLVCALDLMLTNTAIHHAGAIEVNGIAARAIETAGFWGLIVLKVCTMIVVLLACEVIGEACVRRAHPKDTGLKLAEWAVAISAIPVVLTLLQLAFVAVANLMLA